jgi:hypothetical protein
MSQNDVEIFSRKVALYNIKPVQTLEGVFHVHDYTMPLKIAEKKKEN